MRGNPRAIWEARPMARILLWLAAILVVVAVVAQFALPAIAANRIADRLTADGGSASVGMSAFPAVRLLFGDGDRISVRGENLTLTPSSDRASALGRLNGFGHVDVRLTDSTISPISLRTLELRRDGTTPYWLRATAYSSLGAVAIPINLDMRLTNDGGRLVVVSGTGSIAGIPTGPLAQLITSAIAIRF
jgi:hypothetical protein